MVAFLIVESETGPETIVMSQGGFTSTEDAVRWATVQCEQGPPHTFLVYHGDNLVKQASGREIDTLTGIFW